MGEPVEPAIGARRLTVPGGGDVYAGQLAGKRLPDKDQLDDQGRRLLENWAVWDSFKLAQLTADGFAIQKRTNPKAAGSPPAPAGALRGWSLRAM